MTGMLDSLINLKLLLEGIFLLADYKYINHERYNAREMLCLGDAPSVCLSEGWPPTSSM